MIRTCHSYALDVRLHYASGAGWLDFGAPEEEEEEEEGEGEEGGGSGASVNRGVTPRVKRTRDIIGWHISGSPFTVEATLPHPHAAADAAAAAAPAGIHPERGVEGSHGVESAGDPHLSGGALAGIHPYSPTPRCVVSSRKDEEFSGMKEGGGGRGSGGVVQGGTSGSSADREQALAGGELAGRWVQKEVLREGGFLGAGCSAAQDGEIGGGGVCVEGEGDDGYVWLPWRCHLASSSLAGSLARLRHWSDRLAAPRILMAGRLVGGACAGWAL